MHEPVAFLTRPTGALSLQAGPVSTQQFLDHVKAIADSLPGNRYAINLCENRYLFLVTFCAAIFRGQTNLLPQNKNEATQRQFLNEYPDSFIIHDGEDSADTARSVAIADIVVEGNNDALDTVPQIDDDHLACISFTSGSTGRAKPNLKYWRTLHQSTAINSRFMLPDIPDTLYQLATMPAQHMWGLETSALIPLFANVCLSDAKPLFPQDIIDTLNMLPRPRMLVSTPVHLRALTAVPVEDADVRTILCATSPLTPELAGDIEQQFCAPLLEVYGCSEVGSMAIRRTASQHAWRRFDGITFEQDNEKTVASAEHLPVSTELQDFIQPVDEHHFTLAGRATDLIKIAGKRGSLFEINQTLLRFSGLIDGIVIHPDSTRAVTRLCAIVSLKPGIEKSELIGFLKESLDNAFVPRPIYVVDTLPRESNGKLLKTSVDALLSTLRKR